MPRETQTNIPWRSRWIKYIISSISCIENILLSRIRTILSHPLYLLTKSHRELCLNWPEMASFVTSFNVCSFVFHKWICIMHEKVCRALWIRNDENQRIEKVSDQIVILYWPHQCYWIAFSKGIFIQNSKTASVRLPYCEIWTKKRTSSGLENIQISTRKVGQYARIWSTIEIDWLPRVDPISLIRLSNVSTTALVHSALMLKTVISNVRVLRNHPQVQWNLYLCM